jgi:Kef-type K+ transport system membrane component KefB
VEDGSIVYSIFLIFTGAAVLATLALYTRLSLLVVYILLGVLFGPSGLNLVPETTLTNDIGDIGIIFLLFLLGLELTPRDLFHTFRKTTFITIISTIVFAGMGFLGGMAFGFGYIESLLIGIALTFSSTIIGLKLLPTTVLHHRRVGEVMISILLMQDIIAIALLIFLHGASMTGSKLIDMGLAAITLPGLLAFAFFLQHYFIAKLFKRFDGIKEYVFLLAIGWCLGLAEISRLMGLSAEIGGFIAGVAIAEGPIALYISQSLKPLRDFCLVLFFFSIGASFNLQFLPQVIFPALVLTALIITIKPWLFTVLLKRSGEEKKVAAEVGIRLGQNSEFSLLLAYMAVESMPHLLTTKANYLIQATTLLTFIISSYWVVLKYPTPMGFTEKMRKD